MDLADKSELIVNLDAATFNEVQLLLLNLGLVVCSKKAQPARRTAGIETAGICRHSRRRNFVRLGGRS
jgi:hypothetical protein